MRSLALPKALVAIAVLLAAFWWASGSRHDPDLPVADDRVPAAPAPPATERAAEEGAPRDLAATAPARASATTAAVVAFASIDEDGKQLADAVRDGLVLLVRTADGAPCAELPITAQWRKGFGLYGKDVGRTDGNGRFATTVAEAAQFEGIEVEHATIGALHFHDSLLPLADEPRTICLVVPDLGALRVQVVDGRGAPVEAAEVKVEGGGESEVARVHVLRGEERSAVTDAKGRIDILVPHGIHDVAATAEDCTSPQAVRAAVGREGGDALVVLLRAEHRIDVDVRVSLPPGITARKVSAWTKYAPERTPAMQGRGLEPEQRTFFVDRQSDHHFVVRAEDVPWRLFVAAEGCTSAAVDVPRGQREVAIALVVAPVATEPAKARLLVTVENPDGSPANADVRVHETPDFVHGSDTATNRGRAVIECEPGKRVCVSARAYRFPWTVSEPIDLTAGDHEVTLRLQPPLQVSGRVVGAEGTGETRVVLRRPAGPLRGLAEGVPEILEYSPTEDSYGNLFEGRFVFEACGPGDHVVWVFPERGWPAKKRVTPGVDTTIVLGEGIDDLALVQGIVRDVVTMAPIAGVVIRSDASVSGWSIETDVDGRFHLAVRPGTVEVQMRKTGYVLHKVTTANVAPGPAQLDLRLPPSPVLFVRVLDASGAAIEGADVGVLGSDGEPIELLDAAGYVGDREERTNGAGRADLRGAPTGALRVRVVRGEETREFDVAATAGRDAVVDLRW